MIKILLSAIALVVATPAIAENITSPTVSASQILAARNTVPADALFLTLNRTSVSQGKPPTKETAKITLAGDFTAIDTDTAHTIDDFLLCRVLTWTSGASDLDNQSCYVSPAFRLNELYNRKALNGMLTSAIAKEGKAKLPETLQLYWAEQELSVQETLSEPLTVIKNTTGTEFRLDGHVVVQTSRSGFAFSQEEKPRIARYLARHAALHPQVLRAILESGQLPTNITLERRQGENIETEILTFSALSRQKSDYPLPSHLTPSLITVARGNSREAQGIHQIIAALDGTAQPAKPNFNTLMDRFEAALQAKRNLEATLLFQEMFQQYGGSLKSDAARMSRLQSDLPALRIILTEPDIAPFIQASNLAGDAKPTPQNEAAARYLANARDLDALPFGTFRYVTLANLIRISGDTAKWDQAIFSTMPTLADCYWIHIAAYPWAGNAYKDLGDLAYETYQMDKAWQAWDLGRAIDPDWDTSTLSSIARYEERLRQIMPDNF